VQNNFIFIICLIALDKKEVNIWTVPAELVHVGIAGIVGSGEYELIRVFQGLSEQIFKALLNSFSFLFC
jgi:hypothetical protein